MLNRNENRQMKMCVVTLEKLMPQEHFLRDLDRCVDFSFIYEKVEALYSNTGRPSVDPVMLVKMLLIGYLYGIESERRLEQEIRVNIAYRWFLGIELDEPVPDHSTISQLRRRKFSGTTVFQDIFDEIVRKCIEAGLVTGKLLLTIQHISELTLEMILERLLRFPTHLPSIFKNLTEKLMSLVLSRNRLNTILLKLKRLPKV